MFLGMSFASSNESISNTIGSKDTISTLMISNVKADELYATSKVLVRFDWNIPESWDLDTLLHAKYQNSIHAGNIAYSKDVVSSIKIKKRFVGDFEWKTIYEQEVNTSEDFIIEFYDYYEPSNRDIEYAYVMVVNSTDTETAKGQVKSEFTNYFICGTDGESYPMVLDVDNNITYNRESNIIKSPGNKYPYVNNNGITQYYSGTVTATFIQLDDDCKFDFDNSWKYRNEIDQFLANGEPKILKSFEGDIWLVNVVNSIPRTNNGHYQNISQQIEWVEAGSPFNIGDLYDNGFINTDVDRE